MFNIKKVKALKLEICAKDNVIKFLNQEIEKLEQEIKEVGLKRNAKGQFQSVD